MRIQDSAMRQTIAQGSTLSRSAKRFGRTVRASARVVGMPSAFRCSDIRNSRIDDLRTALPSLSSVKFPRSRESFLRGEVRKSRVRGFATALELEFIAFLGMWIRCFEQREGSTVAQLRSPHSELPSSIILRCPINSPRTLKLGHYPKGNVARKSSFHSLNRQSPLSRSPSCRGQDLRRLRG